MKKILLAIMVVTATIVHAQGSDSSTVELINTESWKAFQESSVDGDRLTISYPSCADYIVQLKRSNLYEETINGVSVFPLSKFEDALLLRTSSGSHSFSVTTKLLLAAGGEIREIFDAETTSRNQEDGSELILSKIDSVESSFPELKLSPDLEKSSFWRYQFSTYDWSPSDGRYIRKPISTVFAKEKSSADTVPLFTLNDGKVNMRNEPSKNGQVLWVLPKSTYFEIVDRSAKKEQISGLTNYWYKIVIPGAYPYLDKDAYRIGWVFGAYIK